MTKYLVIIICFCSFQIAYAQDFNDSTVLKVKSFQQLIIHKAVPPNGLHVPQRGMTSNYTPTPVSGKVIHIEGKTTEDIPVKLAPKTDKAGQIELKLPAGTYTIKFGGHQSEIKTIELKGHPVVEFTHIDEIVQGEHVKGVHPPLMRCDCAKLPEPKVW